MEPSYGDMVFDARYKTILIGIVIGLLVGAGAGYVFSQASIAGIKSDIERLETENMELQSQKEQLQEEYDALQDQFDIVMGNLTATRSSLQDLQIDLLETKAKNEELKENYEKIHKNYTNLLNTLNMTIIQNFTQSIEYNITAGTKRTWEFLIPKYGIIWEAKISFSGTYVSMSHAWRRGEERVFVGSSGISLTYKGSEDIVYYGIQDYLCGTITVDYYLDERDHNKLLVTGSIMTNLPTINRGGHAYIDITK